MDNQKKVLRIIKLAYWLGIGADALWAVALFAPPLFGSLIGEAEFRPDIQTKYIMWMGGSLMTGWTLLLIWAIGKPIERRMVILLTAIPVVLGMFIISLVQFISGNSFVLWILIKCIILMASMIISYRLAKENG